MRRRRRRREEFHPENRRKAKKKRASERRQEECERENLNEHSKITLEPLSFSHSFYLLIRLVDAIKQKGDIGSGNERDSGSGVESMLPEPIE
jgi:hypothetical protein